MVEPVQWEDTTQRYLLFDALCSACIELASSIAEATGNKLETLSLYDEKAKALLLSVYPDGWEHVPYLVVVRGQRVQAWSGFQAALRLGLLMGPRNAIRIWKLVQNRSNPNSHLNETLNSAPLLS